MLTNREIAGEPAASWLARDHHIQMLAQASQRQQVHPRCPPAAAGNPDLALRITRRLAAAMLESPVKGLPSG